MRSLQSTLKKEYRYYLQLEQQYVNQAARCFLNGYISRKVVCGKRREYLQFTVDHKLKSVYLSEKEAEMIERQLLQKKRAETALDQIHSDLETLQSVLTAEDQRQCRNDVNICCEPFLQEPSMDQAVGISTDYHQVYFWQAEPADQEKHLWMYYLLIRHNRKQYRIECGKLNEDVRHNIPLLQAYAGWKVDDFITTMNMEAMHEFSVRSHAPERTGSRPDSSG